MRNDHFRPTLMYIFFLALLLSFSPAGATEIFFTVKDKQGKAFVGESTPAGFAGKMQAVKYEGNLTLDQDNASGRSSPTRRGIQGPIKLTKKLGEASPSFHQALTTGKFLTVVMDFTSPSRTGKVTSTHRMILNNALVTGIRQYSEPKGQKLGHMVVLEEITITFQNYELTNTRPTPSSRKSPNLKFRR